MKSLSAFFLWFILVVPVMSQAETFKSDLISVKDRGNGPDVLLIHGFASSGEVWSGIDPQFAAAHRIHVVNIAGFDGRPAPKQQKPESYISAIRDEILRYIQEENLSAPTVVGHSMGGLISLLMGSANSKAVGKIIVVDALPFYGLLFSPFATADQARPFALGYEQQLLHMNEEQFKDQVVKASAILTKSRQNDRRLLQWSLRSDRAAYAQMIREVMTRDARPHLGNVSVPVVVIYAYDKLMPFSQAQLAQLYSDAYKELKGVRFVRIEDSFHFLMWDQPAAFYKQLADAVTD